ncbi:beta-2-glycoprotein 1-like [Salvelinus namaycush]|uniref:Beta-2-glycoprotein 1 n=1 Tax=Salvelinus namaycush TaxID=8040 RepID=A0A8U0Q201_SALNM|nr:beta-2-glycoprotein 1-like [Salvelinus namaycush]
MAPSLSLLLICLLALYTPVTSKKECGRPPLGDGKELEGFQRVYSPGDEVVLSCKRGYTPTSGSRTILCTASGDWTKSKLTCSTKSCSFPEALNHGDMEFVDIVYQSTINYTCHEGYTLQGASTIECLYDGQWSDPPPKCTPVICGLPPIPKYGKMVYDRKLTGNTTVFGFGGTYECFPPLVLIGNERGSCSTNGDWTEPPECKLVTCSAPTGIINGYMTVSDKREHGFKETVRYGCNIDYVLDGPVEIECLKTGDWSMKPACRASCKVGIKRGRILYNGKKFWIKDFKPNKISHADVVLVYCMNKEKKCGYALSTQCIDGKLKIPECFEEPSDLTYKFNYDSLPSEIAQC